LKNPNFSISERRIIIKHLEMSVTEERLREIVLGFLGERKESKNMLVYVRYEIIYSVS
jgi:hypothetical protein